MDLVEIMFFLIGNTNANTKSNYINQALIQRHTLGSYQTLKNNEVRFVLDDPTLVPSLSVMTLKPVERGEKRL